MDCSIIVPLYNEEKRALPFLNELISFCKEGLEDYEIILVNDGSTDRTLSKLKKVQNNNCRIITYSKNRGKGYAIRKGIFSSKAEKVMFIDADGSIKPKEIPKMIEKLEEYDVVVGNRSLEESSINQPLLRKFTSSLFNPYVNLIFGLGIEDNLCGFKGFKSDVARKLFSSLDSTGWIFDVELFYRINKLNFTLTNIPIEWEHKDNSKMSIYDPFKMAFDLIVLKRRLDSKFKEKNGLSGL
ncbi:glycosyltransferase family 2 protein [Candidatus Woesearchaeota archaeon]|nr:glycosyltransferase family 2 protein [Candidatus Woesearchaeota archaeon]